MLLLIDNYDSFTFNLKDYFQQLGEEVLVVENDIISSQNLSDYHFDKVVLSPGPNTPAESGNLMDVIPHIVGRFPVLGICLGHQALGQYFGYPLKLAKRPMHGKVSSLIHNGQGIYQDLPNGFKVCRYHSLIIEVESNTALVQTAQTEDNECMGFAHSNMSVVGMQYHPEAILTENGLKLLDNWLRLIA
ncbi:MAG: aminodeoxychorismate/anthranilate synthase component II [Bacteroidetes bacterium]|nr:aminodeoxychorismate/anthranilate synthase component II [Bacteroidota bacterium]